MEKNSRKNKMLFALQYLTEWSLEATNLLDQGRKGKNGEDVKTHKFHQIIGCAAAAIKLFKGHVLSCKSLKSEMFILHSYSLCWAMSTYSAMQTSAISLFAPDTDRSAVVGEFLHCLGSVGTETEGPACVLSSGNGVFLAVTSTVTRSSSIHAFREDISYLSFLSVLYTTPYCRAMYGAVITFIIVY